MTKSLTRALTLTTAVAVFGAATSVSVTPAEAATVVIDNFEPGQNNGPFAPPNTIGPVPGVVGGFRTITNVVDPIFTGIGGTPGNGAAFFFGFAGSPGSSSLVWDGNAGIPSGLGGVDISPALLGANPRILSTVSNAANLNAGSDAILEVFENGTGTVSTNTVDLTTLTTGDEIEFNYADFDTAINFGNVGAIRLTVNLIPIGASQPSFGFNTALVAIPFNFQSTLGLVALGGMAGAYALSKKRKKALQA
ncbi:hypothetical protein Pse7367_1511 [Thalassoporum mexicanum PCC 7367]|uniref:hypothetical protein n=1 Tax=Thalassoporum mexicanum TaxID=3457544 RepID=UPI00029F8504|nr:hypothetical protein [Pseudanabaena sp. PCC 7367]AFY69800.1 hypothetical protein Pse7367_1511 [Pseudanabaena sp. PCC 7367]